MFGEPLTTPDYIVMVFYRLVSRLFLLLLLTGFWLTTGYF
jgi:hypothetical protein